MFHEKITECLIIDKRYLTMRNEIEHEVIKASFRRSINITRFSSFACSPIRDSKDDVKG